MKIITQKAILLSIICCIFGTCSTSINQQEKLLEIINQIDLELSAIENQSNQPRILSTNLIRQISIYSNSCVLTEVKMDNGEATAELYSIERGKLILALLDRKLAPATYKQIFESVSFQSSFLKDATLKNTNLNRIQLSRSYLVGADFSNANLEGANLYKANLSNANLNAANLEVANLREAILKGADMTNTILKNAYLIDAEIINVDFKNTNFEGALISAKLKKKLKKNEKG